MRASSRALALAGTAAAVAVAAPPAAAAPKVEQLVVQKSGTARQAKVTADRTHVKVGNRTCVVPSATALAALLLSDVPKVRLHDYGSCSDNAGDAGGLFVRSNDGHGNKRTNFGVCLVHGQPGQPSADEPRGGN